MFDKAIKIDSNLIEAYYLAGENYSSIFKLNDEKKAKKYYEKLFLLIEDQDGEIFESKSVRELLVEIGNYFRYLELEKSHNSNIIRAIDIYKIALTKGLPQLFPSYPKIRDNDIYYDIAWSYQELANRMDFDQYYEASDYYREALKYAEKLNSNYEWLREDIITEQKVGLKLYVNFDWSPFRIICTALLKPTNFIKDCKPIVNNNILFVYHQKSIVREKNIVKVWVKEINLKEPSNRASGEYDYSKSLYEFDLKNKKLRVLQKTLYNQDNVIISDDNYPKAEWQFVSPETIGETMLENLKIIVQ